MYLGMEVILGMSKVQVLSNDALPEAPSSPGLTRHRAFEDDGLKVLHSCAEPGTVSGWHNHGDYEVYGYVVSGTARLETGPGGRDSFSADAGDFFTVPPHTVHRELNSSDTDDLEVLLVLRGTGPTVYNVEDPAPA
jgi:quercetin dioxygenase-like cupin family protein